MYTIASQVLRNGLLQRWRATVVAVRAMSLAGKMMYNSYKDSKLSQ
jgi:hypothetical protein